jgi:hypothetical protein
MTFYIDSLVPRRCAALCTRRSALLFLTHNPLVPREEDQHTRPVKLEPSQQGGREPENGTSDEHRFRGSVCRYPGRQVMDGRNRGETKRNLTARQEKENHAVATDSMDEPIERHRLLLQAAPVATTLRSSNQNCDRTREK